MKIKYTNTLEDHIEFIKNDPTSQKSSKKIVVWFSILSILVFMYWKIVSYNKTGELLYLVEGFIFSLLSIVVFIYAYKKTIISSSQKHFENKKNNGFFCEHELVIDDLGINEITEVGNQNTKWSGITKIDETDDYLFIYIGSISAHVVPKKRIEGDLDKFIRLLKHGLNK